MNEHLRKTLDVKGEFLAIAYSAGQGSDRALVAIRRMRGGSGGRAMPYKRVVGIG